MSGDPWYREAQGNTRPTPQGQIGDLEREVRKLWMRLEGAKRQPQPTCQTWSYSGVVNPATVRSGPPFCALYNLSIATVTVTFQVASDLPYIVQLVANGLTVMELDIPAGVTIMSEGVITYVPARATFYPRIMPQPLALGEDMGIIVAYQEVIL